MLAAAARVLDGLLGFDSFGRQARVGSPLVGLLGADVRGKEGGSLPDPIKVRGRFGFETTRLGATTGSGAAGVEAWERPDPRRSVGRRMTSIRAPSQYSQDPVLI